MASSSNDNIARAARLFGELFPRVFLRFHRRDGKRPTLSNASLALLQHLAAAGPLTVGELSRHIDRAQSAVSEMVTHLERDNMLERVRDPRDGRRVLVWLSALGLEVTQQAQHVLSAALLQSAFERMSDADRAALLQGMTALMKAAPSSLQPQKTKESDP